VLDAVEALDFAEPYEVFTTASRLHGRSHPGEAPLFEVCCVARAMEPIQARASLRVLPDSCFADSLPCDLLVAPGGVVDAAVACEETLDWISLTAAQAQITASVCTGAFLLAASGVLTTETVTTHWEDVGDLHNRFPALSVQEGPCYRRRASGHLGRHQRRHRHVPALGGGAGRAGVGGSHGAADGLPVAS